MTQSVNAGTPSASKGRPLTTEEELIAAIFALKTRLDHHIDHAASAPMKIVVGPKGFKPEYQTAGAVGFDIRAAQTIEVGNQPVLVKTDLYVAVPDGFELQIRSRSGLAREGLVVSQGVGTIDQDYRGELKVMLNYLVPGQSFKVFYGDRIAQGVLAPVTIAVFKEELDVANLGTTLRGSGGFGSTGRS